MQFQENFHRANIFFSWTTHSCEVHFSRFLRCICTRSLEGRVRPDSIYFFSTFRSLSGYNAGPASTFRGAHYGDTLCYLWTAGTGFRFWVTSCLCHSSHGWYAALVNNRATQSKSAVPVKNTKRKGTGRHQRIDTQGAEWEVLKRQRWHGKIGVLWWKHEDRGTNSARCQVEHT